MRTFSFILYLIAISFGALGQATFKAGWYTYKTGSVTHEYTYTYIFKDSVKLYLCDSAQTWATADSLVTMTVDYPLHEKVTYKTIHYFNPKKLLIKTEEYKGDNLTSVNEWKYDDKKRKTYHLEDNKANGNIYRKTYEYTNEKNGDAVVLECASFNGRTEFYTRSYYNKNSVKYKEVRLNDNNKDIIHIETYMYGANGKIKERTVYFPEFRVTKKFEENEGNELPKCFQSLPMGSIEKVSLRTRVSYLKKFITRIQAVLNDKECPDFEYNYSNGTNCQIILRSTRVNNTKEVVFRYKENI
jgi:hypothetical protein